MYHLGSLVFLLVVMAQPSRGQILLTVDDVAGNPGETISFNVTLSGVADSGSLVNNATLDLVFPRAVFDVRDAAVCTIDARFDSIDFVHTESLPRDPDAGPGKQRLRLNLIDWSQPLGGITDGRLYSCVLPISPTAGKGFVRIAAARQNVGNDRGEVLPARTIDSIATIGSLRGLLHNGDRCFIDSQCASSLCPHEVCAGPPTSTPTITGTPTISGTPSKTGTVTVTPTPTRRTIEIVIGSTEASQGSVATFDVSLAGVQASGGGVSNAQLDILFLGGIFDVTSGAVCTLDPRFDNSGFAHTESLPADHVREVGYQRLRLSMIDVQQPLGDISDGRLYRCSLPVRSPSRDGLAKLDGTRQNVGDSEGNVLPTRVTDGIVAIGQAALPLANGSLCFAATQCASSYCTQGFCGPRLTPTPPPTPTPIITPRQFRSIQLTIDHSAADRGQVATFNVILGGVEAFGIAANNAQLDLLFPTSVFDVASGDVCTIDPRLTDLYHTESFPTSPPSGEGKGRLRLSIIDTVVPLGDVSDGILYTCRFPVRSDAPLGAFELTATRANVADVNVYALLSTTNNGGVVIFPGGTPTVTPTPHANGFQCLVDSHCLSGICSNYTCCTERCGQSTRCDITGLEGRCAQAEVTGGGCSRDSDCLTENCMNGNPPVCGPRRTPTPTPTSTRKVPVELCQSSSQCAIGLFCESNERVCCEQSECPPGATCRFPGHEGTCTMPAATPTPKRPASSGCSSSTQCSSGFFCTNLVCCEEAACMDGERCDISGFKGNCRLPLGVDEPCEKNSDCANFLSCQVIFGGVLRCEPHWTPTSAVDPTLTPTRSPVPDGSSTNGGASGTTPRISDDDGCAVSPSPARNGVVDYSWLLACLLLWRRRLPAP